jgi:hypothetical protein
LADFLGTGAAFDAAPFLFVCSRSRLAWRKVATDLHAC